MQRTLAQSFKSGYKKEQMDRGGGLENFRTACGVRQSVVRNFQILEWQDRQSHKESLQFNPKTQNGVAVQVGTNRASIHV